MLTRITGFEPIQEPIYARVITHNALSLYSMLIELLIIAPQ